MTSARRGLLGAAVGALLTLLIHPASRPFVLSAFWASGVPKADAPLAGIMPKGEILPEPKSLLVASMWMQAAAERTLVNRQLTDEELDSMIRLGRAASEFDPDNAYWRMMLSVFYRLRGQAPEMMSAWESASRCGALSDYQTDRLAIAHDDLVQRTGARKSWQYSALYYRRSDAWALVLESHARRILDQAPVTSREGLRLRYVTLVNGNLIRMGARSLFAMLIGANVVELSSHPPALLQTASYRKLLLARHAFIDSLRKEGMATEADQASEIYQTNDSWVALTSRRQSSQHVEHLSLAALAVATLPGALLATSIIGMALWFMGARLPRSANFQRALGYPAVFSLGVALGILVYALTFLPLAGVALALCVSFLAFTPRTERTRPPTDLGPLFSFTVGLLSFVFLILLAVYFIALNPATEHVLRSMVWPQEIADNPAVFVGLALIVMGLLLLAAPFWAFALRVRTTLVLASALRSFGRTVGIVGLAMGILAAPFSVFEDRVIEAKLKQIVENEPLYYYLDR